MALYSVEITGRAKDHFRGHVNYIVHKLCNPQAAWHLRDALDQAIDALSDHPEGAPLCADSTLRVFGYRKKRILDTRYLCIYRIEGNTVWIEGIYHESQDHENLFMGLEREQD